MEKLKFTILLLMALLLAAFETAVYAAEPLKMGVFPRRNAELTLKMFSPLADYLSKELGREVIVKTEKTFPRFWRKVQKSQYDIVHYNQLHYLLSHDKYGYDVFAKNEEYGRSSLTPAIIVRKDSNINSIEDLRSKKIIFGGGKLAMIAYVGNKLTLMKNGLFESDYENLIAINPPNAVFSVYHRKADAAAVGDTALEIPLIMKKINVKNLKVLNTNNPHPHLPWAYKSKLDNSLKSNIRKHMLSLSKNKKGQEILKKAGLSNLLPTSNAEYDVSRKIYQSYKELLKK